MKRVVVGIVMALLGLGLVGLTGAWAAEEKSMIEETPIVAPQGEPAVGAVPGTAESAAALGVTLGDELEETIIAGTVASVSAEKKQLTITSTDGTAVTVAINDDETAIWRGFQEIPLTDLKPGEEVEAGFVENGGTKVAQWVDIIGFDALDEILKAPEAGTEPDSATD